MTDEKICQYAESYYEGWECTCKDGCPYGLHTVRGHFEPDSPEVNLCPAHGEPRHLTEAEKASSSLTEKVAAA